MQASGKTLDWDLPGPVLDKHSTGGVGDCVSLVLALGVFLGVSGVQAFQVSGGDSLRVMQSGNPATSSSYTVDSIMRIEPGRLVTQVHKAPVPIPGSAKKNYIVTVCDLAADRCVEMFPTGNDDLYTAYEACLRVSTNKPLACAEDWAIAKGFVPEDQYLALKEAEVSTEEPKLVFDLDEGLIKKDETFLSSAPVLPVEAFVLDSVPERKFSIPMPEALVPTTRKIIVDLDTGDEPLLPSAPIELVSAEAVEVPELLVPRQPVSSLEKEHFSCVKVPGFFIYNDLWKWLAYRLFFVLVMFVIIILLLAFWVFLLWHQSQDRNQKRIKKQMNWFSKWFGVFVLSCVFMPSLTMAQVDTTPQLLIYEGELLDNTGASLAGNYSFRFSFWSNADFENTDVVGGAINGAAVDYYSWEEVQSQVLDTEGRFSFQVGTLTPFVAGMFDQDELFLQVEVKLAADPDTAYELIDVDGADVAIDRKIIASVPFAFNANKLDYRDAGFGPGEIPYLDPVTGLLIESILPDGSDGSLFTIDSDGDALLADSITLQFGEAISESLAWNGLTSQFEFSDDLQVEGNLTVTGTINGVVIGPQNVTDVLSPRYPNSIFEKDGADNSGSMYEEIETITGSVQKQVLRWASETAGTQQDYDTLIRYTLPQNFSTWQDPAIALDYKGPGGIGDAHIDLLVFKEGSALDQLSGNGLDLSSGVWENDSFTLNPATTWTPGDTMWIQIKMFARNTLDARVADVTLNYVVE